MKPIPQAKKLNKVSNPMIWMLLKRLRRNVQQLKLKLTEETT